MPATTFLGREQELAEVAELLQDGARLLTLTGPGGTGKTRLAIQAAAEAADSFPDGIWWVPLASLRDANLLTSSVAQALGIEEQPGRELAESVAAQLTGKQTLLMLDNAEHLMPEVASKVAELRDIAGPTVVVTSRERLQLQGEHVYSVPSLEPEDGVELFLARARSLDSPSEESEAVAELCRRLDNLPLALELAAARTVVFSPEQLVERLSERLDLLKAGRDADPRQQTLRATIEWSYDLLEPEEQRLFRALSVFAGSCNYEAAESVCDADPDTLQSLLDKSLIRRREERGQTALLDAGDDSRARRGARSTAAGEDVERQAPPRRALPRGRALGEPRGGCRGSACVTTSSSPSATTCAPLSHGRSSPASTSWGWSSSSRSRTTGRRACPLKGSSGRRRSWRRADDRRPPTLIGACAPGPGRHGRTGSGGSTSRKRAGSKRLPSRVTSATTGPSRSCCTGSRTPPCDEATRSVFASLAEESLAGHRRAGSFPKGECQALGSLAWVALQEGDHERALELLQQSCALAEEAGFRWWLAGMLTNTGVVSLELGKIGRALAPACDRR